MGPSCAQCVGDSIEYCERFASVRSSARVVSLHGVVVVVDGLGSPPIFAECLALSLATQTHGTYVTRKHITSHIPTLALRRIPAHNYMVEAGHCWTGIEIITTTTTNTASSSSSGLGAQRFPDPANSSHPTAVPPRRVFSRTHVADEPNATTTIHQLCRALAWTITAYPSELL